MKKSILTAALLGGIALPLAGAASPLGTGVQETAKQEAEKAPADPAVPSAKDYEAAYEAYRKKLREADREARKALRKQAPITELLAPLRGARAQEQRARAALARRQHQVEQGHQEGPARAVLSRSSTLSPSITPAPSGSATPSKSLGKNARDFEPKKVAAIYTKVVEGSEDKDVQAQALFFAAPGPSPRRTPRPARRSSPASARTSATPTTSRWPSRCP